jgi:ABC-type hemin transport system ATPase subunit
MHPTMRRSQHRRWRNLQHRLLRRLLAASAAHGFAADEAAVTLVLHAFELNHAAAAALATMARNRRAAAAIDIAVATAEYLNAHFRERVALAISRRTPATACSTAAACFSPG